MRPLLLVLLTVLATGLVLSPVAPVVPAAHGQALSFEQVGDRPIDPDDLAFDADGALWAAASELYRLAPGGSVWEEVNERAYFYVLPLGAADTLLLGGGTTRRSLDGGQTFTEVHDDGERLFEVASGTLIAGARAAAPETGVLRSTDRGATWSWGVLGVGSWGPDGEAFADVPAGLPHAGTIVGAFWAGMAYSDDDGATWGHSTLWEDSGRYLAWDVAVGVDGRVYAGFYEVGVEGLQIAASDDGGRTYGPPYRFGVYHGVGVRVLALPGGADPDVGVVLAVEHDGQVWRSDDGGVPWRLVGRVPVAINEALQDAVVGPDGRLYVAVSRSGSERAWVYRTAGPAVSAAIETEAQPLTPPIVIGPEGGAFDYQVRLRNTTTQPMTFQAWSAVEGPVNREPVEGPKRVTLAPGQSLVRTLTQQVPGNAPPGTYTYAVKAGAFPGTVVSSASFTFVKEGASGVSGGTEGWSVSGWEEAAAEVPREAGVGLSVWPNPASGRAALTVALDEPADVRLALYDVLGREVAALDAGRLDAGTHRLPLDLSALPAGVYVWRLEAGDRVASGRLTVAR